MRLEFGQTVSREDVVRAMQIPDRMDAVPPLSLWKQQLRRLLIFIPFLVLFVIAPLVFICIFSWQGLTQQPLPVADDLSPEEPDFDALLIGSSLIWPPIWLYALWRYRIRVDQTSPHDTAKAFYRLTFLNFRDHRSPFNTKLRPVPKESFDFARSLVAPTAATMQGSHPSENLQQAWQQWFITFLQHIGYPNRPLLSIGGGFGKTSSFASEIVKAPHPRVLVMSVAVGVEWSRLLGQQVVGVTIKKEWLVAGFLCVFTNVLVKIGDRWYVVGDLPPSLQDVRLVR